ncbi:hypothetical protein PDIG_73170 [Penicillium digitatum PHI26]|uniref:Uncharacterized protein n=2 Tax=Penicillium digitatum TaxID=36651 RepID=K9G2J2_PEND2|nr:hypothetical protein PDIP_43650 [Penicillium digitatum Pd1]EKV07456.1 hypothetical protein PDIG_73170 [Penicillium digitatum PHI26]EKV14435.1 hypothetical protein PDIP_43650 [Penicillium digitatum Pd1]
MSFLCIFPTFYPSFLLRGVIYSTDFDDPNWSTTPVKPRFSGLKANNIVGTAQAHLFRANCQGGSTPIIGPGFRTMTELDACNP